MSWKEKLFTLIGKRFISKEEYFNEDGHRYVLINSPYIAVLKSECPSGIKSSSYVDINEYYTIFHISSIGNYYLYYLPYSVKHVYQCFGLKEADITSNSTTIDISSSIGYFRVLFQQEI